MLFFIFVEVKFSLKLVSEGSSFLLSPQNLGLTKVNHLQNFLLGSAAFCDLITRSRSGAGKKGAFKVKAGGAVKP